MPVTSKGLPVHTMRLQESFEVRELKMGTGNVNRKVKPLGLEFIKRIVISQSYVYFEARYAGSANKNAKRRR